ncbi:S26 family signal peptidase [Streptomyces coffeae]|uniref:S26 family signal peptidase n=1 Tax=Streptomyces coffeae TaxID=621382 RepID=UPI001F1AA068|nr:S26 family signal peptidase [Streptomyces coffeae]
MSRATTTLAASIAIAATAIAAVALRRRYVVVTVIGASMSPTLVEGDRVLVRRVPLKAITTGRLVVTEPPHERRWDAVRAHGLLIKRAAAVPGDPLPREGAPALLDLPEERVPEGRIVLLGDNPAASLDSRYCGYFRAEQIVGVVVRPLPLSAK